MRLLGGCTPPTYLLPSRPASRPAPCLLAAVFHQVRDSMHSRAYIGQYSASGEFFIAAYQVRGAELSVGTLMLDKDSGS